MSAANGVTMIGDKPITREWKVKSSEIGIEGVSKLVKESLDQALAIYLNTDNEAEGVPPEVVEALIESIEQLAGVAQQFKDMGMDLTEKQQKVYDAFITKSTLGAAA
jgi:hypothetical protein